MEGERDGLGGGDLKRFVWLPMLFVLAGCRTPMTPPVVRELPKVERTSLGAHTLVRIVLLERLESGLSKEGASFHFAVLQDVKGSNGKVAIEAGTVGQGRVDWSRRGDIGATLIRQPARLAITLGPIKAVEGSEIILGIPNDKVLGEQLGRLEFNAENTNIAGDWKVPEALSREDQEALELVEVLGMRAFEDQEVKKSLRHLAENLGDQTVNDLQSSAKKLAELRLEKVTPGEIAGLVELSGIADRAFDRIGKMLRARQVVAPVGTEIRATVVGTYSLILTPAPDPK